MDLQTKKDSPWRRVLPQQAATTLSGRKRREDETRDMAADKLVDLLGDDTSGQE